MSSKFDTTCKSFHNMYSDMQTFNAVITNTNHELLPSLSTRKHGQPHTVDVAPSEGRTGVTKAVPWVRDAADGLRSQVWLQGGGGGTSP